VSEGHGGYSLMYRLGLKPWEFDSTPRQLVEVADQLPPGRALELGCGTGRQAVELAQRGWDVTGLDYVRRAIEESRSRAETAGVGVRFLVGDAIRLDDVELGVGFDLIYDNKCFHGLRPRSRQVYAEGVGRACRLGGTYLLFALQPGRLRRLLGLPGGVAIAEVQELFAPWFEIVRLDLGKRGPFEPAFYEMRRLKKVVDGPATGPARVDIRLGGC
jgi:SAM-dependent methyltransferase